MHFRHILCILPILAAAAPAQTITMSKSSYVVGEHVSVSFTGSTSPTDWVGFYAAGTPSGSYLTWLYTNGQQGNVGPVIPSGNVLFLPINLIPGAYEARLYANNGYTLLAQAAFQVVTESISPAPLASGDLTVMSFNIWVNAQHGFGGVQRVADVIAAANADIVGLQECSAATTNQILLLLRQMPGYASAQASGAAGVVSRYPITATYTSGGLYGYGVKVTLPSNEEVRFFNSHLTAYPYGPYTIRDGLGVAQALSDELATRHAEMFAVMNQLVDNPFNQPYLATYLVGDHNTPSHLDWTAANAAQNFGVTFLWPVSVLIENRGFRDLFRDVHSDPVVTRGLTWSPGYPKNTLASNDVHDRIDMIYLRPAYGGQTVATIQAYTLDEDPWPADHRAVVVSVDRIDWPGSVPRTELELRCSCPASAMPTALPESRPCQGSFRLELDSPSGQFDSSPALLAMQCGAASATLTPWPQYPASYLNPTVFDPVLVLLFDFSGLSGGRSFSATLPAAFPGLSCRFQGFSLTGGAGNGLFEASNGLEILL